jgi:hypothetical protein
MKPTFDDGWKYWIWHNVERKCSKESIFEILLNNDFDPILIERELDYSPCTESVIQLYNSKVNSANEIKYLGNKPQILDDNIKALSDEIKLIDSSNLDS